MTKDERLKWIARHICGVSVSYNGEPHALASVNPQEIAQDLLELVALREEKARNWRPPPPPVWLQRIRRAFGRSS